MPQVPPGKLVEIVAPLASFQQIAGHHGVENDTRQPNANRAKYQLVVLQILSNLGDRRRLRELA